MIETKLGQTQSGEHHNQSFNDYLLMLQPSIALADLLDEPTHIEHYLASLSPMFPAELEADYDAPRKKLTDEHANLHQGRGFATLLRAQNKLLEIELPFARAARTIDLEQHWVDYAGRKLSKADTTKASRKRIMGAIEMGDTPLIEASSRALMAGYADSAAMKVGAQLRNAGVQWSTGQRRDHNQHCLYAELRQQDGLNEG